LAAAGANVERRVDSGCEEGTAAGHAIVAGDVDMVGMLREVGVPGSSWGGDEVGAVEVAVTTAVLSTVLSTVQHAVVVNSSRCMRWLLDGAGEETVTSMGVWGNGGWVAAAHWACR
jgi:hypothetical protein